MPLWRGPRGRGWRGDAATLWLGTKGAHSALHYDTYENLLHQLRGTALKQTFMAYAAKYSDCGTGPVRPQSKSY